MANGIVPPIQTVEHKLKCALMGCDFEVQRASNRVLGMAQAALNSLSLDATKLLTVKALLEAIRDDIENLSDTVNDIAARNDAHRVRPADTVMERLLAEHEAFTRMEQQARQ